MTIINPTINNMGVAEHYAVGADGVCNLETSGKGLGIVKLNDKSYSVAHTAAQLQALAWAVNEKMGVTTVEVADGTYSDDITLTVAAAGKTVTPGGAVELCYILGKEEALQEKQLLETLYSKLLKVLHLLLQVL